MNGDMKVLHRTLEIPFEKITHKVAEMQSRGWYFKRHIDSRKDKSCGDIVVKLLFEKK